MSQKFTFAGISIDNLPFDSALARFSSLLDNNYQCYVVTPNAAHIKMLHNDEAFKKAYDKAELILPDGMSLIFASRLLGNPIVARLTGADLFGEICRIAAEKQKGIFILGGVNQSEVIAQKKLLTMYPNLLVEAYSPPFGFELDTNETAKIVSLINKSGAKILFICVGSPKSEKWIFEHINNLCINLGLVFGDSLNFFAGTKPRAPAWMRKSGLEWFYRLIREPRRLWKRYLFSNLNFLKLLIAEYIKRKTGLTLISFKQE
ncbi:WecB/TagA/CpsF family glycosyltransferase [candidate division CSSED10-310 bacterium]|uniref:WecB/TagA/CpsF family glycosyltransferase n=1 Tax=candidate division CSSED10-310 bacterium TaxID=2855610 RepID=A0ABV6YQV0_UNCC1